MLKYFLFALYQLTRLPLPAIAYDEKTCGRSATYFPAVGLILGTFLASLWWAAGWFFPVHVQSALLILGMVFLTGGIHLDGFMDTMDGLLSGKAREKKLEIMRDSRVGAFGVIGAICLLLLKYNLILEMPNQTLMRVLPVIPALSRWGMTLAIAAFPYAKDEGLGKIYSLYSGAKEIVGATVIAGAVAGAITGPLGLWLMALSGVVTCIVGRKLTRELGGLTGDIYGFINEFLEVVLLFAVFPLFLVNSGV